MVLSSIGCSYFRSSIEGRLSAIAWSSVSVFDSAVFSLTVYKAFKMGRGIPLLDVIIRDGTMYFLYESFYLPTDETWNILEQGTLHHELGEYFYFCGVPIFCLAVKQNSTSSYAFNFPVFRTFSKIVHLGTYQHALRHSCIPARVKPP